MIQNYITIAGNQKSSISDKDFKLFMSRLSDKLFPFLIKQNLSECYVMFATTTYVLGSRQGSEGSYYMDFIAAYFRAKGLQGILNLKNKDLRRMFLFQFVAASSIEDFKIGEEEVNREELLDHIREVLETPDELIAKLKIYNNFGLYRSIFVDEKTTPEDFYVVFMETLNTYLIGTSNQTTIQDQHIGFDAYLNSAFKLRHGEYLLIKLFNAIYAVNNFELGNYNFEFKSQNVGFSSKACTAYTSFLKKKGDWFNKVWPEILTTGRSDVKGIKGLMQISDEVLTKKIKFIESNHKYTYKPTEVFIISQEEYDQLLSKYGTLEKLEQEKRKNDNNFKAVLIKKGDGQIIDIRHNVVVGEKGKLIEVNKRDIGMKPEKSDEKSLPEGTQPKKDKLDDKIPVRKAKNRGEEEFDEPQLFGDESIEKVLSNLDDGINGKKQLIGGKHDYNPYTKSKIQEDKVPLLGTGHHDEIGVKIGEKRQGGLSGKGGYEQIRVNIGEKGQDRSFNADHINKLKAELEKKRQGGSSSKGRQDRFDVEIEEDRVPMFGKGGHDKIQAEVRNILQNGNLAKESQGGIKVELGKKSFDNKTVIINKTISITINNCNVSQSINTKTAAKQLDPDYQYFTVVDGETQKISRSHFDDIFNKCKENFNMDKVQLLEEGFPESEPFKGQIGTGDTRKDKITYTIENCVISQINFSEFQNQIK